ncbi:hypothetical protein [Schauerella aestuarii]|uniref:hypothetical protein n=1 Tax=Schauerella aestuarii TaxID=2511204 RepID=UPI00136DF3E7|nr:hypothetical protein [Achromobacter aestuarii]MYZ43057.1 hypothetical protein [Achromobacter aestuarii]
MPLLPEDIATLNTCAFCPNTCRPSYPARADLQIEAQTPSALSLLTLAVLARRVQRDSDTLHALSRRDAADASRGHCTYGFDMPAVLTRALDQTEDVSHG